MNQNSSGYKQEDLATERMLADVRLVLSITSALIAAKLASEVDIDVKAAIVSLTGMLLYSIAMRLTVQVFPRGIKTAAVISSFLEVGLITYLIWSTWWYTTVSPFYLWYVFYIMSIALRYGGHYAILGLGTSIVLYTAVAMSRSKPVPFVPGFLGSTGFLFVLAFLFAHMSDRQRDYRKQLLVANELGIKLASLPSSREMIDYLVAHTTELLELGKCWFIQTRGGDDTEYEVFSNGVELEGKDIRGLLGECSPEAVLQGGKMLVLSRPERDSRIPTETVRSLSLKSLAAVPLFERDVAVGVLYAANRSPYGFSRYDLDLLSLLATQAAPVIENSQLWEKLKDAAASEERLRIARDLHDNFLQTLAAVKLHLERLRMLVSKDPSRAEPAIDRLHEIASQGLAEVRIYLSELRMVGPEPARFGQAVARLVEEASSKAAFTPHIKVDLPPSGIPPQVSLTVFQIIRELLNNIARHAGAANVWISAHMDGASMVVELKDDGAGFSPPVDLRDYAANGHLGLVGVRERVDALSGELNIDSSPGQGTTVTVRLPVRHV